MARQPFSDMPVVMERASKAVQASTQFFMRRAAKAIGSTAARLTRVDTGLARSNWVATLDAPFVGIIPPYAPGMKQGIDETANLTGAQFQQLSAISAFDLKKHRSIHITNNVHYIGFLNNGSPTTTVDLMFEKAIQAGRRSLRGLKIEVVKVRR